PIAYITNAGDLYLAGSITKSDVSGLSGTNLEIRDSSNSLIAYFDSSGNLNLGGVLIEQYNG
ncbi:MAG: hypothetical protein ACLFTH_03325, partial [Candidatus Woesearchaeota archaeon]